MVSAGGWVCVEEGVCALVVFLGGGAGAGA